MNLDLYIWLSIIAVVGSLAGCAGFLLMRRKFTIELMMRKQNEAELAKRVYETAILKEIGERIGYSLDGAKIVEIISGSLGNLLPYSTVSYMILGKELEKIRFTCKIVEPVSSYFVTDVKAKMIAALTAMTGQTITAGDIDESLTGGVLDEKSQSRVESFFNLPITISGKLAGIINIASHAENLYNEENTEVLYRIAGQASQAVSRLHEVLENEKAKLSQAVESLADGVLMVDTKYRLVLINKRLCGFLALAKNPSLFDIVNALSGRLDIRTMMEEATGRDQEVNVREVVVRDRVFQVAASKVLERKSNEPMGVVVLFHDITDAKSLEQLRRDFTAMMVHELRAPLTNIRSSVELLKEKLTKVNANECVQYLAVVDSASSGMLTLVGDLLDIAKLEAGKFDIICETGDVAEAVLGRVEDFRAQAESKGLKLTCEIENNLPEGYFDKIRIKQVLNNLISNALKYTGKGEIKVKVSSQITGGAPVDILVSVADTGEGIDQDQIEVLFEKFGQLANARSKGALKSTGLGLYIAKKIVESWQGRIWVQSDGIGTGSTFYFTIPFAQNKSGQKKIENHIWQKYL